AGEGEILRVARDAVQIEEELRDARGSAALAHVVPEALRALAGNAARQDPVGRAADPRHPRRIAGGRIQLVEEPRRARRTVAPAEGIEVEAVRLIVLDERVVDIGHRY